MILDGKLVAKKTRSLIKSIIKKNQLKPGLATILVGADPASQIYVGSKQKTAKRLGFHSIQIDLPADCSEYTLSKTIEDLNQNSEIHGILLQLPLPKHLNANHHLAQITPQKDVDGFHPLNVGGLSLSLDVLAPCTPKGVIRLLNAYQIPLGGLNAVIVGRSNIVGRPIAQLLLQQNATVSVLHSSTKNMHEFTKNADLIVCATGIAKLIGPTHLGRGCHLIDVGINRLEDGSIVGDLDYDALRNHQFCASITPVPGGVGPMTIAMLMENCLLAYINQSQLEINALQELSNIRVN
ncbi:MAG: bifunctional 5,10-methylenetetrahydrofolate dehydrogenase/5,10-methenyltetrahydrofolate cyclohydrolase [bacterium]|nr:bifunctional 5,10-methylenetetrahydrofolate dehydrogenase/5,10-methenyltetrahydrofolate cyclohydrolase [bacterium]